MNLAGMSLVVAIDPLKAPAVTDLVIAGGRPENHQLLSRRRRVLNIRHLRPHPKLTSRKARHRLEVPVPPEASRNERELRESGDRDLPVLWESTAMCPVEAVTALKRTVNENGSDESYGRKKGRRKENLSLSGTNRSNPVRSGERGIVIGHGTETEIGKANGHGNATGIAIGTTKDVIETRKGRETMIEGTEIVTETAIVNGTDQGSGIVTEIGSGVGIETGTETMNGEIATRTETMIGGIVIVIVTGTEEVEVLAGGKRGETTGGMRDEKKSGRGKVVGETANPIVSPGVKGRIRTMYRLIGIFLADHDVVVYTVNTEHLAQPRFLRPLC